MFGPGRSKDIARAAISISERSSYGSDAIMGNGGFDGGGYGREDSGICGGGYPKCGICEDGEESCGDDSEGMSRPL